jgi:hypothetical protein
MKNLFALRRVSATFSALSSPEQESRSLAFWLLAGCYVGLAVLMAFILLQA